MLEGSDEFFEVGSYTVGDRVLLFFSLDSMVFFGLTCECRERDEWRENG